MTDFYCNRCLMRKHIKHLGEVSKTHSHVKTCDSCVESREKNQRQFISKVKPEVRNAGIDKQAKEIRERIDELSFDLEVQRIMRGFDSV